MADRDGGCRRVDGKEKTRFRLRRGCCRHGQLYRNRETWRRCEASRHEQTDEKNIYIYSHPAGPRMGSARGTEPAPCKPGGGNCLCWQQRMLVLRGTAIAARFGRREARDRRIRAKEGRTPPRFPTLPAAAERGTAALDNESAGGGPQHARPPVRDTGLSFQASSIDRLFTALASKKPRARAQNERATQLRNHSSANGAVAPRFL